MTGPDSEGLQAEAVHIFERANFKLGKECTTLCGIRYVPTGLHPAPTCEACETALGTIMAAGVPGPVLTWVADSGGSSPVVPLVGAVPVEVPEEAAINELATALMDAWATAEPNHSITKHPVSYVATFVDLARAAYPLIAARVRAEVRRPAASTKDAWFALCHAAATGTDLARENARADYDAAVRAEERQRAASELQRFFKDYRGVDWGDVIELSRLILGTGSAVPVVTPESSEDLLAKHAAYISRTVTASYPDGMDPELVMRRRVGKIFVEAGELGDAIEGWTGENPRKGAYATREDVIKELIDCASASLCAIEYMTGDGGLSVGMVAQQVIGNAQRLSESIPDCCGPDVGPVATPTKPDHDHQPDRACPRCGDLNRRDGELHRIGKSPILPAEPDDGPTHEQIDRSRAENGLPPLYADEQDGQLATTPDPIDLLTALQRSIDRARGVKQDGAAPAKSSAALNCDTCDDTGAVRMEYDGSPGSGGWFSCPDCMPTPSVPVDEPVEQDGQR